MKVLCPRCDRLLELTRYRMEGEVLVLVCSACGAEARVGASAGASSNVVSFRPQPVASAAAEPVPVDLNPFEPPQGNCPKCISPRAPSALGCASCGLIFAHAKPDAFAPPDWLAGDWAGLQAGWADETRHEALRNTARQRGDLAALGRLYRVRLAWTPADLAARRGRDEVLRLAVLPALPTGVSQPPEAGGTWRYVLAAVVILGSLFAIFYMLRMMLAAPV